MAKSHLRHDLGNYLLRDGWPLAAVVAVALAARLLWIAAVHPLAGLFDDAGYYDYFARSLAAGHGYRMPWGTPTAFWPAGFPASLAAVYLIAAPSLIAAKLFNAAFGAATAALVYILARHWFSRPQAMAGGLIFALMPGAIGFASLTLSESIFTFLFTATVLVMSTAPTRGHRFPFLLAFAVIAAAATYVRGQALLLPLVAAPWLLAQGWQFRPSLVFAVRTMAVVVALCLPWSLRNTLAFHEPIFLSTNLGVNLWAGHHAGANGGLQFGQQVEFAGRFAGLPSIEQEPAESRAGLTEASSFATHHPRDELDLAGRKVLRLYRDDSDAIRWNEHNGDAPIFSAQARHRLRGVFDGYYYFSAALALASLGLGLLGRRPWAVLVALVVAYWTAVHIVFFAEPRFHAPLLPLICWLAGVALVGLTTTLRRLLRR